MTTTLKKVLLCITVLGLAACKQASIVAPTNNYVSTDIPSSFEISFSGGIPTDLEIQLNTADVTEYFTVTETGAVASGASLSDHIFSGRNIFRLKANSLVSQRAFFYDRQGPMVHILDVDRQAMTVTGYVTDPGGISSLTLDGRFRMKKKLGIGINENLSTAINGI